MTTEDYCSFELSKLLKEKGFDEECEWYYPKDGGEREQLLLDELNYDYQRGQFIKSPSHALAMKWLREKGYHIVVFTDSPKYEVKIQDLNDGSFNILDITHTYDTYEEAAEAAIKYCLTNLINNETN